MSTFTSNHPARRVHIACPKGKRLHPPPYWIELLEEREYLTSHPLFDLASGLLAIQNDSDSTHPADVGEVQPNAPIAPSEALLVGNHFSDEDLSNRKTDTVAGTRVNDVTLGYALPNFTNNSEVVNPGVLVLGSAPIPSQPRVDLGSPAEDSTPFIVWVPLQNADHYELRIDNLTTGEIKYIYEPSLTTNRYTVSTPMDEAEYCVYVRGVNSRGEAGPWGSRFFTVNVPTPERTSIAPIGTTADLTPTFSWGAVSQAERYELRVDNLTTGTIRYISEPALTTTTFTPTVPMEEGQYCVYVRGINSVGEIGAWDSTFFTVEVPTPASPLIAPIGTTADTTPTFNWDAVIHANYYELRVDNLTTGTIRYISEPALRTRTFTPSVPMEEGEYCVYVRAINTVGELGAWGSIFFTVDVPTPTSPSIAPIGTTADTTPTFNWEAVSHVNYYELRVDNLTTGTIRYISEPALRTRTFTPSVPMEQGCYCIYVRGINNLGEMGAWASTFFTVDVPTPASPLIAPIGTTANTTPTFNWSDVGFADHYELRIDNLTTGMIRYLDELALTTTTFTPSAPMDLGSYCVYVRGINSVGEVGVWGSRFFNITAGGMNAPMMVSAFRSETILGESGPWVMDAVVTELVDVHRFKAQSETHDWLFEENVDDLFTEVESVAALFENMPLTEG